MKYGFLGVALIVFHAMCSEGAEPAEAKEPVFGSWRGFAVGTYIIEKQTYRGVKYHADGIEYRKTILAGVGDSGAAKFQDYTSEAATGPWKISTAHGDVAPGRPGERRESKYLGEEDVTAGAQTFRCAVTVMVQTDDWGKLTTTEWTDKQSGVVLRQQRQHEGQDRKGQPSRWTASLVTTGIEKRSVDGEEFECFVQEHQWSPEMGGQWSRTWATSKVPEHRVAAVSAKLRGAPPELEIEMVEWGRDVSVLAGMKETSPLFFKERMQKDDEDRKRRSEQMEDEMIANLASGETRRMLSGMNAISQWADIIPAPIKAAAIEALNKAPDHPAVEVRRAAGGALGKLGVKGLSLRLAEMFRKDPEGIYQYLEALGRQADAEALRAILPSLGDADETHRRAAVSALRFFREAEARDAVEKALADPAWLVRLAAAESLEKMADPRCVPALVRILHDENPTMVSVAIRVICALGDDSAVPPLLDLLKTGNKEVRAVVCLWIGKMRLARPSVVGDAMLPLLEDPDAQTRFGAVVALGAFRERRAVPGLLQMIREPIDPKSVERPQAIALIALGEIGDPSAIPPLAKLLDSPEAGESVAEALMKIGDPTAATLLFEHYVRTAGDEKFSRVHRKEIEAIGKVGTAQTRAALEEYLAKCPPPQKSDIREAILGIDQRLPR
jgi:HEAT repeat protein